MSATVEEIIHHVSSLDIRNLTHMLWSLFNLACKSSWPSRVTSWISQNSTHKHITGSAHSALFRPLGVHWTVNLLNCRCECSFWLACLVVVCCFCCAFCVCKFSRCLVQIVSWVLNKIREWTAVWFLCRCRYRLCINIWQVNSATYAINTSAWSILP